MLINLNEGYSFILNKLYGILIKFSLANNYEVSEWEVFFLKIWMKNPTETYITAPVLLSEIGVRDLPIFTLYFKPFSIYFDNNIDGKVDIGIFIEFICVFAFFSNKEILPCIYIIFSVNINI